VSRRLRASGRLAAVLVTASITACGGDDAEPATERSPQKAETAAAASRADGLGVRAKRACLGAAAIDTTLRRRKPDDDDAPDARLFLKSDVTALVGLYNDVDRARRYEPKVRANLKPVDGLVERRGNVTIGWVGRPGAALRRTVQRCVFKATRGE
jgi:hypothetical protein